METMTSDGETHEDRQTAADKGEVVLLELVKEGRHREARSLRRLLGLARRPGTGRQNDTFTQH